MEGKGYEAKKGTNNWMPGYDPNRIPASVFASKPTIGWSFASSDTFYSIQNDSFSTSEPRELPEVGEPSSEPAISRSLPIVVEESRASPMSAQTTNEVVTVKDQAEHQHSNAKTPSSINVQHSSRISIASNDSHIIINSFAFPILAGADQKIHSATFEVVFKGETVPKPEAQSMTKEEPSQKESEDKEPQTSAQIVKGGWCCCWLKCFSCCRLC